MVTKRKPEWIRYKIPGGKEYLKVKSIVRDLGLHTICTEAKCPNAGECFAKGTATFLILGDICTRNCRYCAVKKGIPSAPDFHEPEKIAVAVKTLNLKYAVITSVTRDDLADGGASQFAETCRLIKEFVSECKVELLIPDFKKTMKSSLEIILQENIHILNHNIETVKEFFPKLRPAGDYSHSLRLLKSASGMGARVKSGIMIGFGETFDEIKSTMSDIITNGCRILTVGQYLSPGTGHYEVVKYYHPDEFSEIRRIGLEMGFENVMSAPNVRSSYNADTSL